MTLQSLTKLRLARLYFPGESANVASQRLRRWMLKCKPLMKALRDEHYEPRCKVLAARHVRLIIDYLGEP